MERLLFSASSIASLLFAEENVTGVSSLGDLHDHRLKAKELKGCQRAAPPQSPHMPKFKCWYYEQAIKDGSEDRLKTLIPDHLPDGIRKAYENARC